jgi:site-specific DNA-methyltransferase (adenine-specific)
VTLPSDVQQVLAGSRRWAVVNAKCEDFLPLLPDKSVDHCISDPPYSAKQHANVRSAKRNELPDVADFGCRTRRVVDLGFDHLRPALRRKVAGECFRAVKRWSMFFADVESCWLWRLSCEAAGLEYARTVLWHRIGGAPQFTGDKPAAGFETITVVHQKERHGKKRWNGGGKAGVYESPIVANRLGQRGSRVHETQKPLDLMVELVTDFTDPDELVVDPFCGSATTGAACLRLGRRFIGIEQRADHAATSSDRLAAEVDGSSIQARRAGQGVLFGGSR